MGKVSGEALTRGAMDPELKEALEALHDFRQFWFDQVSIHCGGGGHGNPMWLRVAEVLDKHGMNNGPGGRRRYYQDDPAYRVRD